MEDAIISWPFEEFLEELGDDSDAGAFERKMQIIEMQESGTALHSKPAAGNVKNKGAPAAGPVTRSVLQHTPAFPDTSHFCLSELLQPQGATDASCQGSSTVGRKRKATNASNAGKTTKSKKLKKWQQTTPCQDPGEEKKRLNAIKSHNDRVKKNNEVKVKENFIHHLLQENNGLKETIQELRQELEKLRVELREEKHKNLSPEEKINKQEILRSNQELMVQNQIMSEFLQQAKLSG